jgi:hypothetical protein
MQIPAFFSSPYLPSSQNPAAAQVERTALSIEQLLQLQVEVLGRRHFAEVASAPAQQLAAKLGCDRVSIGWLNPYGIVVVAASYVAQLHVRQETARLVADAMDEAAEQARTLIHPEPDGAKPRVRLAHEELARRQGYALCTLPLVHAGQLSWGPDQDPTRRQRSKDAKSQSDQVSG